MIAQRPVVWPRLVSRRRRWTRALRQPPLWIDAVAPALTVALLLAFWELLARRIVRDDLVLPPPDTVFRRIWEATTDGTLPGNAGVTLHEAGLGFLLGAAIALPLGYAMARLPLLERLLAPLIAASQAVPAVAIAPLLVVWLGNGLAPKVAVGTVVVVFPLLVSTVTGVRGVPREFLEVAAVFGAPAWERVLRVELPLAAPVILGGVKLSLTLSLIGALVGEFVASDQGLGFLLNYARANFDTPLLFAVLVTLAAISIILYNFVSSLEGIVARWQG